MVNWPWPAARHHTAACSFLSFSEMRDRIRTKARKHIGHDKQFNKGRKEEEKQNKRKQNKWYKSSPSEVSQCQFLTNGYPSSPQSSPYYLLVNIMLYDMEYSGQFRSAVWCIGCIPSQTLAHTYWGAEWEREKSLILCKYSSAEAKTVVCYQHRFGHKSKTTASYWLLWWKLTLSQPDPEHQTQKISWEMTVEWSFKNTYSVRKAQKKIFLFVCFFKVGWCQTMYYY